MTQPDIPDPEVVEDDDDATTAPNNVDSLRDEMIISINLYLEALAKLDGDNEGDTPRLIPVDWAVIMTGFPDTGDAEQFYYRMDASGPPHTQVGIARVLQLALES